VTAVARPDGMLIRKTSDWNIHLLEGGLKRYITDSQSLSSYNFLQPICPISPPEMNGYQAGSNMRAREGTMFAASGGPVYILELGPGVVYWKRWIVSADAFNYYGLSWGGIQTWPAGQVNSYGTTDSAHPFKSLFVGHWPECTQPCNYASWITLNEDRHYDCGDCLANWGAAVPGAIGTWQNSPTTARFVNQTTHSTAWHVHTYVNNFPDMWSGDVDHYDQGGSHCNPPNCIWKYTNVRLNNARPPVGSRQITTEHELGHAIALAHDGVDPVSGEDIRDNLCLNVKTGGGVGPTRVPRSVMDYDCQDQMYGVQSWDYCGVNHAYVDPAWGSAGC
jgi:hypothetical protein